MNRKKIWSSELEDMLEQMVDYIRQSIINETECFADFMKKDEVDAQSLSVANYKAVCLLNHANQAVIIKSAGLDEGVKIIKSLEDSAQKAVTEALYNDVIDKVPPELRDMFKRKFGPDDENEEDVW